MRWRAVRSYRYVMFVSSELIGNTEFVVANLAVPRVVITISTSNESSVWGVRFSGVWEPTIDHRRVQNH